MVSRVLNSLSKKMTTPHKRQPDRFDLLLAEKKLNPETARKWGDLPRAPLPPGVKFVRIPVELVEERLSFRMLF